MAVKERSFWSTTSGVVTGVAGTLTGVVGIVTLAAQMGWIGGGDGGNDSASVRSGGSVATSVAPGATGSGSSSGATGSQGSTTPIFSVDPTSVAFESLGNRKSTVKVVNDGSVALSVQSPRIEGANPTQFSATAPTCVGKPLAAGRSCEIEVTFAPSRSGTYKATLVIQVTGAPAREVPLSGQSLL